MQVELVRFRVKKGKTERVDAWMAFLNDHMEETLKTLEPEKMYVESIHREWIGDDEYLYWYSVQGEGGRNVEDSDSEIDRVHLAFWEECVDPDIPPALVRTQVVMIPHAVREAMERQGALAETGCGK